LKGKVSNGMWKKGKDNGKGGQDFERVFDNTCEGFAFSCWW